MPQECISQSQPEVCEGEKRANWTRFQAVGIFKGTRGFPRFPAVRLCNLVIMEPNYTMYALYTIRADPIREISKWKITVEHSNHFFSWISPFFFQYEHSLDKPRVCGISLLVVYQYSIPEKQNSHPAGNLGIDHKVPTILKSGYQLSRISWCRSPATDSSNWLQLLEARISLLETGNGPSTPTWHHVRHLLQ